MSCYLCNYRVNDLDAFISANDAVTNVDVIRRDIRDTGLGKIALYRYRLKLKDGSIIELTERIIEERGQVNTTKYRFHWQNKSGELIKRWDNAPHHPEINSFPDHLHDGAVDNVKSFKKCSALDILTGIINEMVTF